MVTFTDTHLEANLNNSKHTFIDDGTDMNIVIIDNVKQCGQTDGQKSLLNSWLIELERIETYTQERAQRIAMNELM